jgi:hypothetical protein
MLPEFMTEWWFLILMLVLLVILLIVLCFAMPVAVVLAVRFLSRDRGEAD